MNIRNRNGKWQIRQTQDGVNYSLTIDHKPGKREAEELMREHIDTNAYSLDSETFGEYANRYISAKENVLSPSTIRLYKQMVGTMPESLLNKKLRKITQEDIQSAINEYAKTHSPKSTRNLHGLIAPIISMYRPNFKWKVTLPQKVNTDYTIPTPEDVRKVLEQAKGTDYEIVLRLGTYGLRRSEAIAITSDDLDGNTLTINKAKVISDDGTYVEKTTKTTQSTRMIYIDDELADMIRQKGKAYTLHPNNIIEHLHTFQRKANVPKFRYHDLRHFFATELLGKISDSDLCYLGGWSQSGYVMKKVYTHARADRDAEIRQRAAEQISKKIWTEFGQENDKPL